MHVNQHTLVNFGSEEVSLELGPGKAGIVGLVPGANTTDYKNI